MNVRCWLAEVLFFIGHALIRWSVLTMGYTDVAKELKDSKAHWLKAESVKAEVKGGFPVE